MGFFDDDATTGKKAPIEVLLQIYAYLGPEDAGKLARTSHFFEQAGRDALLWENLSKVHFEDDFDKAVNAVAEGSNWFHEFVEIYQKEYQPIEPARRKIMSLVKEGDIAGLDAVGFNSSYFHKSDKYGNLLLNWAHRKKQQALLNFLYPHLVNYFPDLSLPLRIYAAILCQQPIEIIAKLIHESGMDINSVSSLDVLSIFKYPQVDKMTLLAYAARLGRLDVVRYLIERGAVDATIQGTSALNCAVLGQHQEVVDELINRFTYEWSIADVLGLAASLGCLDIISALFKIKRGIAPAEIDSALTVAVAQGNFEVVEFLLAKQIDGHRNQELLCIAIGKGDKNLFELLLSRGVKLESHVLIYAIQRQPHTKQAERFEIIEMILKRADLLSPAALSQVLSYTTSVTNILKDSNGRTLNLTVGLLDDGRADIYCKNNPLGLGALLHRAVINNQVEAVNALLEHPIDLSCPNPQTKESLLHVAVRAGNPEIVRCLIDAGADLNATIGYVQTPLLLAASLDRIDLVNLFLDRFSTPAFPQRLGLTWDNVNNWLKLGVYSEAVNARDDDDYLRTISFFGLFDLTGYGYCAKDKKAAALALTKYLSGDLTIEELSVHAGALCNGRLRHICSTLLTYDELEEIKQLSNENSTIGCFL